MRTILKVIDYVTELAARAASWLCVVLILLMSYEVIMRFVFRKPSMWAFETSIMLGTCIYVIGWSYVQRHRGHIKVEIIYEHLTSRGKVLLDVVGHLIFLFPLFVIFTYASFDAAWEAWELNERMVLTRWYPPFAPLRTVVVIASFLLLLQSFANFFRDFYFLVRNKNYD